MFVIAFEEQGHRWFAGMARDGIGYALTINTAMTFDSEADAKNLLELAYGPSMQEVAVIQPVG